MTDLASGKQKQQQKRNKHAYLSKTPFLPYSQAQIHSKHLSFREVKVAWQGRGHSGCSCFSLPLLPSHSFHVLYYGFPMRWSPFQEYLLCHWFSRCCREYLLCHEAPLPVCFSHFLFSALPVQRLCLSFPFCNCFSQRYHQLAVLEHKKFSWNQICLTWGTHALFSWKPPLQHAPLPEHCHGHLAWSLGEATAEKHRLECTVQAVYMPDDIVLNSPWDESKKRMGWIVGLILFSVENPFFCLPC